MVPSAAFQRRLVWSCGNRYSLPSRATIGPGILCLFHAAGSSWENSKSGVTVWFGISSSNTFCPVLSLLPVTRTVTRPEVSPDRIGTVMELACHVSGATGVTSMSFSVTVPLSVPNHAPVMMMLSPDSDTLAHSTTGVYCAVSPSSERSSMPPLVQWASASLWMVQPFRIRTRSRASSA